MTDDGGATASDAKNITPISLQAREYKQSGLQKVDLSWTGPSAVSFDVYRNGVRITSIAATSYTDNINTKGRGSYTYEVCAPAAASCSNTAKVGFWTPAAHTVIARTLRVLMARRCSIAF